MLWASSLCIVLSEGMVLLKFVGHLILSHVAGLKHLLKGTKTSQENQIII